MAELSITWKGFIGETERILGEVERGESFVITVDEEPVAALKFIKAKHVSGVQHGTNHAR